MTNNNLGSQHDFAGLPFADDDASLARHIADLSVPTLMLSMVHMAGGISVLDGLPRPAGIYLNEVQGFMSDEDQQLVRERALQVIGNYRDGGCVLPGPLSADLIHQMMNLLVVQEVSDEYVPLLLEELGLDAPDTREVALEGISAEKRSGFNVVVIGAGMSGILAAQRLEHAGFAYTVIEKNAGVGGTWYENRYPGARVDVGNHFYCYSFAPRDDWSEFFARQPELQSYFEDCAHEFDIYRNIRFGTEVVSAKWDEGRALWGVLIRNADGSVEELSADAVISAVGQLNRPKLPEIEGRDSFGGLSMHSAAWVDGTDLTGKRVAVIGTGASAFQIVPTIAPEVESLSVFQRSAPWMFPNPHYHDAVGEGVAWAMRHLPYYGRWYRLLIFWPACDGGLPAMKVDPEWPHQDRAVSAINDAARDFFTQWMVEQVKGDAELAAKIVPDYVCLGKRTLQDNGSWLGALTRDNVDLITNPIDRIVAEGIITDDGELHELDVIVYATGFHANRYLWPMEIIGREASVLGEQWGDEPTAYLGITIPNFPNLFCIYGPGTNLAHGGSLFFHSECQVRYIMECLEILLKSEKRSIECTALAHDEYNDRLQAELETMIWSHPSIRSSWYRNDSGRIFILSPWRLVDYWSWTRQPDPDAFILS